MNKNLEQSDLKNLTSVIESLSKLMYPLLEINITDLKTKRNIISNNLSNSSKASKVKLNDSDYYFENIGSKSFKTISHIFKNAKNEDIAIVTFRFDTTVFKNTNDLLNNFLQTKEPELEKIFTGTYEDTILNFINEFVRQNNTSIENLTKSQKKEIIKALYDKGVFNFKNAANYLGKLLDLSRASVYNYLK